MTGGERTSDWMLRGECLAILVGAFPICCLAQIPVKSTPDKSSVQISAYLEQAQSEDTRPPKIEACVLLTARRRSVAGSLSDGRTTPDDTERIQLALKQCKPGQAVVLANDSDKDAFLSGPLILPRGVTLFVEKSVTLYARSDPREYDLWPRSCGVVGSIRQGCKPFLFAYYSARCAVMGSGTIDGQGSVPLHGVGKSWWNLATEAKRIGKKVSVPDLISTYESPVFRVRGLTLKNAPGSHLAIYKTIGFRAIDTDIQALGAGAAANGILLSNSPNGSIFNVLLHVPGSAIDIRASILGDTSHVEISNLRVTGGQGIQFGDNVFGDVQDISIDHAILDGALLHFNFTGKRNGSLHDVRIHDMCLHNIARPLIAQQANGVLKDVMPTDAQVTFEGVVVSGRGTLGATGLQANNTAVCPVDEVTTKRSPSWDIDMKTINAPSMRPRLVVGADSKADVRTIQEAIDELPISGGDVAVEPGIYREVVTIRKPHVHLHGEVADERKTTLVFDNTSSKSGGAFNSATLFVEATDVSVDHLTIANDAGSGVGQALALAVSADRATFRNLRLLGAQDTLYAGSQLCYGDHGPCVPARQYFKDCTIAGNVDFIFGDGMAVFDRCTLQGIAGKTVWYTAQSKHYSEQQSGYIFDHCTVVADSAAEKLSLGRPWRPHATVIFLNTQLDAPVIPEGWTEWPRFGIASLPVAFYAEFNSKGPGSSTSNREPYSHQFTALQAKEWSPEHFLAGNDGWRPMK